MVYKGFCYCKEIQYEIDISSPDEARTSLCHCKNCKVCPTFIIQTTPYKVVLVSPLIHGSSLILTEVLRDWYAQSIHHGYLQPGATCKQLT